MNSELQQMRATIKAIGDAVADLSQVCEALPQLFESKLASIRADVAANVAGLREALAESGEKQAAGLAELQASQATLAGQLTARCGAVEAAAADAVQTAEARTAEIIANNGCKRKAYCPRDQDRG